MINTVKTFSKAENTKKAGKTFPVSLSFSPVSLLLFLSVSVFLSPCLLTASSFQVVLVL